LADADNTGDHGSSRVFPPYVVTPVQGLRAALAGSGVEVRHYAGRSLRRAKSLASRADAVLVVAGCGPYDEGEYLLPLPLGCGLGGDRTSLELHARDARLIAAAAPLAPRSAVVLIGGSAILVEPWREKVHAILYAFYPGMEGGTAIARTLLGQSNPGGKLPFCVPTSARHLPHFDRFARTCEYDMLHGYTKLDAEGNDARFAFGHGLSYTRFALSQARAERDRTTVRVAARLDNVGHVDGDEVLQLYVAVLRSALARPPKLLRAFKRVHLGAGASCDIMLSFPLDKLRVYDERARAWHHDPGALFQLLLGTSASKHHLSPVGEPFVIGQEDHEHGMLANSRL
jgi:beta-glucosidase